VWAPYDEQTVLDDFSAWGTNFLDNVSRCRHAFRTGGRQVVVNMEERQRVKIVDYVGSKKVETSKIDEKLKEEAVTIRLDSFIAGLIRRVAWIVPRYRRVNADVKPRQGMAGGQLVHLSFGITEGRRSDSGVGCRQPGGERREAEQEDEGEQARGLLSFITGGGTWEAKFAEDAEM
jgi:hypothetical protein